MKTGAPLILLMTAVGFGLETQSDRSGVATVKANIPYADAQPILRDLREDLLPAELRAKTPAERESAWPAWVSRRDSEIRARLARGDEDSILNFLLLGTTFTKRPRLLNLASLRSPGDELATLNGRLDDFIAAISSANVNERLGFVREVIKGRGIDPQASEGTREIRAYLLEILARVIKETESRAGTVESIGLVDDPMAKLAYASTLFQDRGLSSDTSIIPSLGIDQALEDIEAEGRFRDNRVRRVAIVGPGLDFVDGREGSDVYPVQTIQPFAVIDSLVRLGLADLDNLQVTTLDISSRVNGHLMAARERAAAGGDYVVHLPRNETESGPWSEDLVKYWQRFGETIGTEARIAAASSNGDGIRVRAVRIRPAVVMSIVPQDLNIVLQRLEPIADDERFDLIIATNILVYYDIFEQSLAVANVAKMLRHGGLLLSNNIITELPTTHLHLVGYSDVVYIPSAVGDRILAYELP